MIVSQIRRSDTANKRPDPALLLSGELALNYDFATGGVYYTNDAGTLTKIGPAQLSATAPNSTPAGSAGNALGEFWYDTANNELNIWDGATWVIVSGGGNTPGSYANGGRLLEAIGPTATAAAVLVNFTNAQINDLPGISYSNGIFTNSTAQTRTYTFDFTLCLNNAGGYITDLTLWYQKNSTANADPTNSYGLNQFSKGYTTNDAKNDRTSWTFTLEPGETVTCWASFTPQSVQFGGAGQGTTSGYSTRVNVTEVVTAATGYQSGGFAEYGNTQSALAAGVSARVAWNAVTTAPDYTLTYDSGTNSFTNNTLQTRTYTFNASMGGTASQLFTEWDGWFTLNNPTGVVSSTTRFGQQSVSDTGFGEFSTRPQALRTFSWTVTLLPGESVQTWQYCNVNFTSNGPIQTPGTTFGSGTAMKLRVTEIQAAQSPDWGGRFEARMPSTSYTGSGNNILNAWSLVDNNTITSLSYSNGIFTNSTNQDRTYKISFNVTLSNAALQERYYTWIQWDASTASATNRLSYFTDDTREYLTSSVAAASLSITLAPGGTFSTWFYTDGAGTKTIGGASLGMDANYSTRIAIQDVTGIQSGFGTITGVNAGVGLSGGGTTGTVTLNLDPATSSTLGGVKQGTNVTIAPDGTISVPNATAAAGANTQIQFNNAGAFGANADFTYNGAVLGVPGITGAGSAGTFTISGGNAQGLTLRAGNGGAAAQAPGTGLYGGNTAELFAAGDVIVQGGSNTAAGAGARGGNVTISGGTSTNASAGTVNISNIATASTTATYVPAAATDLTTKAYVDSLSTPPAGGNGQLQFNNGGVFGAASYLNLDSNLGVLTVPSIVGSGAPGGGFTFTIEAAAGQGVSVSAGQGSASNQAPGAGLYGGNNTFDQPAGDVVVQGGRNSGTGTGARGGNVTISGGTSVLGTAGTVNISNIATASATATYTPTAATDLATKSYVDSQRTLPAGSNAQVQFNDNGAFGAEAGFEYDSTNNVLKSINYSSNGSVSVYGAPGSGPSAGGNLTLAAGSAGTGAISPAVLNILGADNPATNVTSLGGSINIVAGTGQRPLASGVSGGTITISGGAGRAFFGATVASGDVNIQGGNGTGSFNQGAANGGNVNITGGGFYNGGAAGVVNITSIATATATATYTPTAATHLTTKSYVDTLIGAQAAGTNTQIQFNNNGAFGASADLFFNASSGIFGAPSFVGTGTAGTLSIFGGTNQGLTLSAGSGTNAAPAPGAGLYGGNTAQLFNGGDVIIQGGNNSAAGAGARGGNVTISGGTSDNADAGTVNISNIATASATATYVPTANTDLATKAYVDTGVVSFDGGTF